MPQNNYSSVDFSTTSKFENHSLLVGHMRIVSRLDVVGGRDALLILAHKGRLTGGRNPGRGPRRLPRGAPSRWNSVSREHE